MKPGEVIIIGTSHISRKSVDEVTREILKQKPDVVALELDMHRAHALVTKPRSPGLKDIRRMGARGFLLAWLGYWLQQRLGKIAGIAPGSEMRAAMKAARQTGARLAFIDQDISLTMKRLSRELKWKERFKIVLGLFFGKKLKIDVEQPSSQSVRQIIAYLKKHYPALHRVLIEERNRYMAIRLAEISKSGMSVIAVVGRGHKDGLERLLKKELG